METQDDLKQKDPKVGAVARLIISKKYVLTAILFLGEKGSGSIEDLNDIHHFDEVTVREMEKCDLVDYNREKNTLSLTPYGIKIYSASNRILESSPSED